MMNATGMRFAGRDAQRAVPHGATRSGGVKHPARRVQNPHHFRAIDLAFPAIVVIVITCLAVFWSPSTADSWKPHGSPAVSNLSEDNNLSPRVAPRALTLVANPSSKAETSES